MIVVKLKGGMGNQMFQYALGRTLSIKHNVPLKLDIEIYKNKNLSIERHYDLDVFNIVEEIVKKDEIPFLYRTYGQNKYLSKISELFKKVIKNKGNELFFHFDPKILSLGSNTYLDGYWQSPKYFTDIEDVIRKDFTLKNPLSQNIKNLMNEIKNQNSLCLHVRRGDYVGNKYHEVVDKEYYNKGVDYISKITKIDKIYVFSDDIKWCEENISLKFPTMFVGEEYSGSKAGGHLFLMSACKYFVIPNSSFSWWAVWLNTDKDKVVVAPKKWFNDEYINTNDLIPNTWIRI